jgi:hypothetical protein
MRRGESEEATYFRERLEDARGDTRELVSRLGRFLYRHRKAAQQSGPFREVFTACSISKDTINGPCA